MTERNRCVATRRRSRCRGSRPNTHRHHGTCDLFQIPMIRSRTAIRGQRRDQGQPRPSTSNVSDWNGGESARARAGPSQLPDQRTRRLQWREPPRLCLSANEVRAGSNGAAPPGSEYCAGGLPANRRPLADWQRTRCGRPPAWAAPRSSEHGVGALPANRRPLADLQRAAARVGLKQSPALPKVSASVARRGLRGRGRLALGLVGTAVCRMRRRVVDRRGRPVGLVGAARRRGAVAAG